MKKKGSNGNNTIFFVLVFIVQIIISNYVPISPYVYICLLPLIIISLPLNWRPVPMLLLAFGMGLLLDLLCGGILGLNAGAAVFAAALKRLSYKMFVTRDRQDKTIHATPKTIGSGKFFVFLTSSIILYSLAYVLMDCISFRDWTFILIKFAASVIVNVALSVLLSISFLNRD